MAAFHNLGPTVVLGSVVGRHILALMADQVNVAWNRSQTRMGGPETAVRHMDQVDQHSYQVVHLGCTVLVRLFLENARFRIRGEVLFALDPLPPRRQKLPLLLLPQSPLGLLSHHHSHLEVLPCLHCMDRLCHSPEGSCRDLGLSSFGNSSFHWSTVAVVGSRPSFFDTRVLGQMPRMEVTDFHTRLVARCMVGHLVLPSSLRNRLCWIHRIFPIHRQRAPEDILQRYWVDCRWQAISD